MRARFWPKGASLLAVIIVSALFAGAVAFAASPSIFNGFLSGKLNSSSGSRNNAAGIAKTETVVAKGLAMPLPGRMFFMPQVGESIATYASDCTTAKENFSTGDTVCAKATGFSVYPRKIYWIDPDGLIAFVDDVNENTPSASRQINMRGVWRAYLVDGSDGSLRLSASFSVSDAAHPSVDLSVVNNAVSNAVAAGGNVIYRVIVRNEGPDTANNVQLTEPAPNNTTFVSKSEPTGVTCSSDTTCTIPSLGPGEFALFSFTYQVDGGTPVGTVIVTTAQVASDNTTEELRASDNEWKETVNVVDAANAGGGNEGGACFLTCPEDVVKQADTTQNNQAGAIIHFGAPAGTDECGTITTDHPNDSFYAVGTYVVTASGAGGSCTFTIQVTAPPPTPPPTISCPAPVTKNAAQGECSATVSAQELGSPTAEGDEVTVEGARSDGHALTDPYPGGTTTITWTATDKFNRTAKCTQTVTINVDDNVPPTITAPPDVTINTGAAATTCSVFVGEGTLGQATADDNCSNPQITRTGVPSGNVFPAGVTTITYTATDGAGNTATATQKVTVIENAPPVIYAPADASYTCLSDVPAASPSQAFGPQVGSNGKPIFDSNGQLIPGGPVYDNCGTPTVTVTETSTGAGNPSSPRVITRTYTATDASGNSSSAVQTITVIDPTPPTFTNVPSNITVYLPLNSTATSVPVTFNVTATDNCAGVVVTTTPASGSTFPVGTTTVTATATDTGGNSVSTTFTVTVLYNFTGFFSPVANTPTLNVVNAGRAIPVKFSLSGNKGLSIFAPGSPQSGVIPCDASAPAVDLVGTVTAGGSSLSYDASSDQYIYVWKTESSWAGTCRQLVVTLNDGTSHVANFKFK